MYLLSFYYIISTIVTVGFGDITPSTLGQRSLICAVLVVGIWVYSNLISLISKMATTSG